MSYYIKKKTIIFDQKFNELLSNEIIEVMKNMKKIKFGYSFNKPIDLSLFEKTTSIYFGQLFNQRICHNNTSLLPKNCKKLILGFYFNQPIYVYPDRLQIIHYGVFFNQPFGFVDNNKCISYLPKTLKKIVFKNHMDSDNFYWLSLFNQDINHYLPDGLEYLELSGRFNLVVNYFPRNLKTLIFGNDFNQPLNNLPKEGEYYDEILEKKVYTLGLEVLCFGSNFNQELSCDHDNNCGSSVILPNKLKKLVLGGDFDKKIGVLPNSLEFFSLGNKCFDIWRISKFNKEINILPNNLKILILSDNFSFKLKNLRLDKIKNVNDCSLVEDCDMRVLEFGNKFNSNVKRFPENVKKIKFGFNFNQSLNNSLWGNNIKEIKFGYNFNKKVNNLPKSLEKITFGFKFNKLIDNLPINMKEIILGVEFDQYVNNLPSGLEKIFFGNYFDKPINNLPLSIKEIHLGYLFNNSIDMLPDSVEVISIGYSFDRGNLYRCSKVNFRRKINRLPKNCKFLVLNRKEKVGNNIRLICDKKVGLKIFSKITN